MSGSTCASRWRPRRRNRNAHLGQHEAGLWHDFLVSYLDSIDERLLEYLDDEGELKPEVVQRLRFYTTALLDGSLTLDHVVEDWPDWFQLAPAFVAAYGTDELSKSKSPRCSWKLSKSTRSEPHRG
jgi:hypothetical protein